MGPKERQTLKAGGFEPIGGFSSSVRPRIARKEGKGLNRSQRKDPAKTYKSTSEA